MKILIFLHGTSIMHRSALGKSREDRVRQVRENDPSVVRYEEYIPVGNVIDKINGWLSQGAEITYLSSHRAGADVEKDRYVLKKFNFPSGVVSYRKEGESYSDIAEEIVPDILIEDDCQSIGGKKEMTYTYIDPEIKRKIKSIPVKEFGGIDHLPDDLEDLMNYQITSS